MFICVIIKAAINKAIETLDKISIRFLSKIECSFFILSYREHITLLIIKPKARYY